MATRHILLPYSQLDYWAESSKSPSYWNFILYSVQNYVRTLLIERINSEMEVELGLCCISWVHHLNYASHCIVLFIDTIEKNAFRDRLVYFSAISRYVFVSLWQILTIVEYFLPTFCQCWHFYEKRQHHITGFH